MSAVVIYDLPQTIPFNWRVRWKKGVRIFTQKWTLSKTLQISYAVLFRCVKQCSVCVFPEICFVFEILRMQKNLYLLSRQRVTAKTVISLKIQQNIDLSQRVTLKNVEFRFSKPLKCWFNVKAWQRALLFHLKASKLVILRSAEAQKRPFQA